MAIREQDNGLLQPLGCEIARQPANSLAPIFNSRLEWNSPVSIKPIAQLFEIHLEAGTFPRGVILGRRNAITVSKASSRRDVPRWRPLFPAW
jgi:hypothetical protein